MQFKQRISECWIFVSPRKHSPKARLQPVRGLLRTRRSSQAICQSWGIRDRRPSVNSGRGGWVRGGRGKCSHVKGIIWEQSQGITAGWRDYISLRRDTNCSLCFDGQQNGALLTRFQPFFFHSKLEETYKPPTVLTDPTKPRRVMDVNLQWRKGVNIHACPCLNAGLEGYDPKTWSADGEQRSSLFRVCFIQKTFGN